jgi:hypothetical protein
MNIMVPRFASKASPGRAIRTKSAGDASFLRPSHDCAFRDPSAILASDNLKGGAVDGLGRSVARSAEATTGLREPHHLLLLEDDGDLPGRPPPSEREWQASVSHHRVFG